MRRSIGPSGCQRGGCCCGEVEGADSSGMRGLGVRVWDGEVDSNLAGKIAFMINILRAVIADSELAQRIEKLEKEMEKRESA